MGWVTINGTHVLIQDGIVTKGPSSMLGKYMKFVGVDSDGTNLYSSVKDWVHNGGAIRRATQGNPKLIESDKVERNKKSAERLEQFVSDGTGVSETIFRGLNNLSEDTFKTLTTKGSVINQRGLSSWSTNETTADFYRGVDKDKGVLLVQRGSRMSRKLEDLSSEFGKVESEVIMSSKSSQIVDGTSVDSSGYYKVFLREIDNMSK